MNMTHSNNFTTPSFQTASLIKRMLIGAAIGLVLMSIFLAGADVNRPEWGKFWMVRPFLVIAVAGAGGGVFNYFMDLLLGYKGGWKKTLTVVISVIGLIITLYLGFVLGFVGTLWH